MRLRAAIVLSVVSAGLGAGLVACFDLFHSTSGILDACQLDAEACGDAAPLVDFCSWDSGTAYTNAGIACAWLEACQTPLDHHDFGDCMFRALLAYDCNANSARPTGTAKQMWNALWQAKSCTDVNGVVFFPGGVAQPCGAGRTGYGCQTAEGDAGYVTQVYCVDGSAAAAENCALWNQTCVPGDPTQSRCVGCLGCYPDDGEGGACTPDATATCSSDGVATSCPAGVPVSINCAELLQQPNACNSGPLSPQADPDPTSPCYLDAGAVAADADVDAESGSPTSGCTESCSGTTVTGCARGVAFKFDCAMIDASCQSVQTPDLVPHGAACAFTP
jgi:hypothetical protein